MDGLEQRSIEEGVRQGVRPFPKAETSQALLQLSARMWVERGLGAEDFLKRAEEAFREASGEH